MHAMRAYRPFAKVGVLYTPSENNSRAVLAELQRLGNEMGFTVVARPFALDAAGKPSPLGTAGKLAEIRAAGAEWLYLPPDSFLGTQAESLVIPAAHALGLPTLRKAKISG